MEDVTGWFFVFLNILLVNFGYNFFKKKNYTNLKIGWIVLTLTWILLGILQGFVTQSFNDNDILQVLSFNLPFTLICGGFTLWYKIYKNKNKSSK
jgi:hypothetical protein